MSCAAWSVCGMGHMPVLLVTTGIQTITDTQFISMDRGSLGTVTLASQDINQYGEEGYTVEEMQSELKGDREKM